MKKTYFMAALALILAMPAFAVIGRQGSSLDTSDPEQEYIKIKNAEASSAMSNGDLVTADNTAADGVSMVLTTVTNQEVVCVVAESIATGKFGKCQVYGYHSAVKVNGTTNAVVTGGRLASSTFTGKASGTAAGFSIGKALTTTSITIPSTVPAFLHLR